MFQKFALRRVISQAAIEYCARSRISPPFSQCPKCSRQSLGILIIGVGVVNARLPGGYAPPPAFLTAQDWFNGSLLAPHFYGLEPLTRTIFSLVLPGSVGGYFTQLLGR